MRTRYLLPLTQLKGDIEARLVMQNKLQNKITSELTKIQQNTPHLRDQAGKLDKLMTDILHSHAMLVQRTTSVLRRHYSHVPLLSEPEREYCNELRLTGRYIKENAAKLIDLQGNASAVLDDYDAVCPKSAAFITRFWVICPRNPTHKN